MRDFLASVGFCVLMAILAWLYCAATPDQMSGEHDLAAEEMGVAK